MLSSILVYSLSSFAYKIGRLVKFIFSGFIPTKHNLNFELTKMNFMTQQN